MLFSDSFLEEIRSKLPISKVISTKVNLKKFGNHYKGLCPFHSEKTPSFTVHDNKGMYYCFGCHANGDIFKFVSETHNLNFNESVRFLADLAGLKLPEQNVAIYKQEVKNKSIIELLSLTSVWFEKQLNLSKNNHALEYLLNRGLKDDEIKGFSLGYTPSSGLISYLTKNGFSMNLMEEAGLVTKLPNREYSEKFKNRIIFPIKNQKNQVVGFGGRALDSETIPKYLNSPETSVFKKKNILYAADRAKPNCLKKNRVILVEGYLDAIFMHQVGFDETVASLGTAFGEAHVEMLKKLADEIIICFDNDDAGKKAMIRAAQVIFTYLDPGFHFKFCLLNGGKDPDEIIHNHGVKYLSSLIENSLGIADYIFEYEKKELKSKSPEATALFEYKIQEYVNKIKNPIVLAHFRSYFKNKLWNEMSYRSTKKTVKKPASFNLVPAYSDLSKLKRLEYSIFAQILNNPEILKNKEIFEEINSIDILPPELEELREILLLCNENDNFNQDFLKNLLLEKKLDRLYEFLCGAESSFIDHYIKREDENVKNIWFLTHKKYVLELHLEEYRNILLKVCNDDNIYEKAVALKKVIDELSNQIHNIEINI